MNTQRVVTIISDPLNLGSTPADHTDQLFFSHRHIEASQHREVGSHCFQAPYRGHTWFKLKNLKMHSFISWH